MRSPSWPTVSAPRPSCGARDGGRRYPALMDEVLADTQLRVYVRDLTSGELVAYPASEWLIAYAEGINAAIEMWQASLGGTIAIYRHPGAGPRHRQRRRPCDRARRAVVDRCRRSRRNPALRVGWR